MTGLDTNILARFIAQDDPDEARRADEFLQSLTPESPGYISLVALAELVWVLRRRYGLNKSQLIECLNRLLDSPELVLDCQTSVGQALHRFANSKADFPDCLIERLGHAAGCKETVTFDTDGSRFSGMKLL
jgi:predicted nucleic-acid-binding protein